MRYLNKVASPKQGQIQSFFLVLFCSSSDLKSRETLLVSKFTEKKENNLRKRLKMQKSN